MSNDNFKKAINNNIKKFIFENFQHIFIPPCLLAKTTKVEGNKVNLKILDVNKKEDDNYPELANIYTDITVEVDDIVVLNFINGELEYPIIIRKLG
ncbi:hypothetical protein [[Clostridium] colinum]|uniref:hypothetical protein n=1 Tax=[Clostridium] colinum TaxID=36835 RepID=UPI00202522FD|nr:hypothetical protein [[Clostridium] colinum]